MKASLINIRLTSRYSAGSYAFAVKGLCALFSAFKIRSGTQFDGCTHCVRSVDTNLTLITCPSPKSFVSNLPDSGRHVTRPNQGLSMGRRENLETRLRLRFFQRSWQNFCLGEGGGAEWGVWIKNGMSHCKVSLVFLPHFDVFCDLLLNWPTVHGIFLYYTTIRKEKRPPTLNRVTIRGFALL